MSRAQYQYNSPYENLLSQYNTPLVQNNNTGNNPDVQPNNAPTINSQHIIVIAILSILGIIIFISRQRTNNTSYDKPNPKRSKQQPLYQTTLRKKKRITYKPKRAIK